MEPLPPSFVRTRIAVHNVAEHVLCVARYSVVGRVGLLPIEHGLATPAFAGRVVGVRGTEIFDRRDGSEERREPLTTLRAASAFLGVTAGCPPLWTPTTAGDLDAPLDADPAAVDALAAWYLMTGEAIARVYPDAAQTLWPEHFDLAATVDGVTYGGSPGDEYRELPYLYVLAPEGWSGRADDPTFWNEPFGAAVGYHDIGGVEDAVRFFEEGRDRIAGQEAVTP